MPPCDPCRRCSGIRRSVGSRAGTVVTESTSRGLPKTWAPVLNAMTGDGVLWPEIGSQAAGQDVEIAPDGWLRLPRGCVARALSRR